MKILAVDTSSQACSCALVEDGKLISESYLNTGLTHSRTLTSLIRETMNRAGVTSADIDRYAVCIGPGSYTGLRIGISAVKGMAMANDTPCVGVSTLMSLAQNVADTDSKVLAALDARVGQIYGALFENRNGTVTRLTPDDAIPFSELSVLIPEGALVVGDGAELVAQKFPEKHLKVASAAVRYQRASSAAMLAQDAEAQPAALIVPDYHRKSQAEREREARLHNEEKEK